jgi:rod shape-determining protein MreD
LVLSLVAALLVQGAAARLFGGSGLFPNLVLIVLFIWSIGGLTSLRRRCCWLVGLIQDLFTGGPFGIWALAYIVAFTAARDREADGAGGEVGPMVVRFAALAAIAQFTRLGGGIGCHCSASAGWRIDRRDDFDHRSMSAFRLGFRPAA